MKETHKRDPQNRCTDHLDNTFVVPERYHA